MRTIQEGESFSRLQVTGPEDLMIEVRGPRFRGRVYGKADLLMWARDLNPGFDLSYLVEALDALPRYTDVDLSLGAVDVAAVRTFFSEWAAELRQDRC